MVCKMITFINRTIFHSPLIKRSCSFYLKRVVVIRAPINCLNNAANQSWLCIQADLLHSPEYYMGRRHLHWQGLPFFLLFFLFFKSICPVSLTVFPLSFLYVLTRQRPTALKPFKLLFTAMRYWGSIFAIHKVQEQAPLSKSNSFLPLSFPLSSEWYLFLHIEDSERKC